jgi:hypothetical protein
VVGFPATRSSLGCCFLFWPPGLALHVSILWVPGTVAWQRFATWYAGIG